METIRDTVYRDEIGRLTPNLRRLARALVRNHNTDVSDELVQATLVKALAADHPRRGSRLLIWLVSILTGLHRDQVREASAEQQLRSSGNDAQAAPASQRWSAGHAPRRDPVLLNGVPLEYREALLLIVIENMTYAQAAECLGLSANTVANRVARAREYLTEAQGALSSNSAPVPGHGKMARSGAPYLRVVK